ncbi:hypothetical protein C8Q77DRAFT_118600 [Trametes polyzona]|nr:hypothetical protein C8Q77DRAFT_118600 [Trametes polyzona]
MSRTLRLNPPEHLHPSALFFWMVQHVQPIPHDESRSIGVCLSVDPLRQIFWPSFCIATNWNHRRTVLDTSRHLFEIPALLSAATSIPMSVLVRSSPTLLGLKRPRQPHPRRQEDLQYRRWTASKRYAYPSPTPSKSPRRLPRWQGRTYLIGAAPCPFVCPPSRALVLGCTHTAASRFVGRTLPTVRPQTSDGPCASWTRYLEARSRPGGRRARI